MKIPLRKLSSTFLKKPNKILKEIYSNSLLVNWLSSNHTENIFDNRNDLYAYINYHISKGGPIDFLEFGVYEGASLFYWSELNQHAESRYFGFDTFHGLPEAFDRIKHIDPKGHFDTGGTLPITNDQRVNFVKGLFQDTLSGFISKFNLKNPIIIHNDSDLYTSTLFLLTKLDNILCNGTVIIFDEFFCSSHEFQAFFDYSTSYHKKYKLIAGTMENPPVQVAIQFL